MPLSLLLLDLDGFAASNAVFGHLCADDVLLAVSRLLSARFAPEAALLARIGSDAFALLLPCVQETRMKELATELLQAVLDLRIAHPRAVGPFLGVSIGLATAVSLPGPASQEARQLLQRAELALARARLMKGNPCCQG
jgi:diguanylate cyclase (GGDEF)-like protein